MKITVLGGSGLVGSKLVGVLRQQGHDVVAASLDSGVNALTGEGLEGALANARVAVDVTNSPSFEEDVAPRFFETSGRNIIAAERRAGVGHHVALSVVGTERLLEVGYFRAKLAQEELVKASPIPYTLVRSCQFFEFLPGIIEDAAVDQSVRVSPALIQPIAAADLAGALADVAVSPPLNDTVEVAGPEPFSIAQLVERFMAKTGDSRPVIADRNARYFGALLEERTLIPGAKPRLGATNFETWFQTFTPRA